MDWAKISSESTHANSGHAILSMSAVAVTAAATAAATVATAAADTADDADALLLLRNKEHDNITGNNSSNSIPHQSLLGKRKQTLVGEITDRFVHEPKWQWLAITDRFVHELLLLLQQLA